MLKGSGEGRRIARSFMVAHLVGASTGRASPVRRIIAVPADSLDRPTIIVTEDGKTWVWGGMYQHFPNTGFYIEVQAAYFSNRIMAVLSRAVPTLERQGVL